MKPDIRRTVSNRQSEQVNNLRSAKIQQFTVIQSVLTRDYRGLQKWSPAIVLSCDGPMTYKVKVRPDLNWRRHIEPLLE